MSEDYKVQYKYGAGDLARLNVISINSNNNLIKFNGKVKLDLALTIKFVNSRDNVVEIGSDCKIRELQVVCWGRRNKLKIGDRCTFGARNEIELGGGIDNNEKFPVEIGDDCMFSKRTIIKNADGHPILDPISMMQINDPKRGVFIGDHVWVGMQATILKGAHVSDCCIVGSNAIVTKDVPPRSAVLGLNNVSERDAIWSRGGAEKSKSEALYYYYKSYGFEHQNISDVFSVFQDKEPSLRKVFVEYATKSRSVNLLSKDYFLKVAEFCEEKGFPFSSEFREIALRIDSAV
ncbi:acyltransferase [Thioclava sp. BHET1]|nr:acyltransferase [Thioclava sp. BHET1]